MLELQLLGAFRLLRDGRPQALPTRKCQALLALLALEGRCTRSRLAGLLWPDADESAARRNLRVELHRLRQAGLDAALRDADDAVELIGLTCDAQALDLARGAAPDAAQLALVRGPLLDGLDLRGTPEFDAWLAHQRERYGRAVRTALVEQAGAFERAGELKDALGAWRRLLALDDLQESHYAQAMRLHAALGEREAALALYQQCLNTLGRELGLRPLPATMALAERIRIGSLPAPHASHGGDTPDSGSARAATAALLPEAAPFVGRQTEREEALRVLASGGVVCLLGAGGIGKTRLALELCDAAAPGACLVVAARAGDGAMPYHCALRALRALPAAAWPASIRSELARLMPELGPSGPPLASDADRARFIGAVTQAFVAAWPPGCTAWVLDDWHHADTGSTTLLLHVRQALRDAGRPVRLVMAWREEEMPAALAERLQRAARPGCVLTLPPLPAADTAALVRQLSGTEGRLFAQRLHQATGGSPMFLMETLKHLAAQGLLSLDSQGRWSTPFDADTADYRELPVAPTVQAAIQARLKTVGDGVRRLLEAASLLSEDFSLEHLQGCTALDDFAAVDALERAADAHLLRAARPGRWRFGHDLLQHAVADGLTPERRRLLHGRLAQALRAEGAAPVQVASHLELAGRLREAAALRLEAGRALQGLYDHAHALIEYDRALADRPEPRLEVELRTARIDALRHLGDTQARLAEVQRLNELARTLGDRDLGSDASIQLALIHGDLGQRAESWQAAESAVALQPHAPAAQLRALRIAAWAALAAGQEQRAAELVGDAMPLAETMDPSAFVSLLSMRCRMACDAGDLEQAERDYLCARAHPGFALRPMIQSQLCGDGARLRLGQRRHDEMLVLQRESLAYAQEAGAAPSVLVAQHNLIHHLLIAGRIDEAERERQALPPATDGPLQAYASASAAAHLAGVAGRMTEAVERAGHAIEQADVLGDAQARRFERVLLARWLIALGDATAAHAAARSAAALEPRPGLHRLGAAVAEAHARLALGTEPPGTIGRALRQAIERAQPDEWNVWYQAQASDLLARFPLAPPERKKRPRAAPRS